MSIPKEQQIICPKCGKSYKITIWESIDTDLYAHVPKNIISGNLFKVTCPKCKYVANLEYDILYHDMKHKEMVWVVSTSDANYEKRVEEVRNTNLLHYSNTRIVSDMNELKEKVSALESGRDDRLIELAKVFFKHNLLKERSNFEFRNAFYSFNEEKEIVYLYDKKGDYLHCFLEEDIYEWIKETFLDKVNNFTKGDFQIFNFEIAEKMFLEVADEHAKAEKIDEQKREILKENITKEKVKIKVSENNMKRAEFITKKPITPQNKICFCRKCGNKLLEDSEFCSYCGTQIIKEINYEM